MIYSEEPKNFIKKFEVASCFLEYQGKILLLKRASHKSQPNTYGVPAGKKENNENILEAIKRELAEETSYKANSEEIKDIQKVFVRTEEYDFAYYISRVELETEPNIKISEEHTEYIWSAPLEALELELIHDLDNCIKLVYDKNWEIPSL